jgi:hypothetical protein
MRDGKLEPWCPECFAFVGETGEGKLSNHRTQSMDRCAGSGLPVQYRERVQARGISALRIPNE